MSVRLLHKNHKSCTKLIWPFYGILQLYEVRLQKSHNSLTSVQSITNRVLSSFDRFSGSMRSEHKYHKSCSELTWPFYSLLQLYELKLQKSHISVSSVHKYHKSCSQLIWAFYGLLQLYELKLQKAHISVSSVTSITNRVLSSFDRFKTY